jgi:TatD DNase family protein
MKLIDTHAHLDFPQFKDDLDQVVKNAKEKGVYKIVNISCNPERAKACLEIADRFENVFCAVGIHPDEHVKEGDFEEISKLARHKKVVAIGECGLDFFREENPDRKIQEEMFLRHINLAKSLYKPVVVHFRNAYDEALDFLIRHHDFEFVVHCFSEDLRFAEKIIELGGMISFTGILTFKNAKLIKEVASSLPLDRIMLETDCPFLAPQRYRGERCEPAYVYEIADYLADLRDLSLAEIAEITTFNAERFFGI